MAPSSPLGTITRARSSRGHPRPSCLLPTEPRRGRAVARRAQLGLPRWPGPSHGAGLPGSYRGREGPPWILGQSQSTLSQPAHGGWGGGGSVGEALLARSPVTSVPWDPRRHLLLFFPSCRVGQALRLNEAATHPEGSGEGGSWKKPHPVPHSLGWRTALAKANRTVSSASHAVVVPGPGP